MSSFADLAAGLTGRVPGLTPPLAESFLTQAWTDVLNARLWSFLTNDAAVVCPALVTTGTFAYTRYTSTATASAAASAALAALATSLTGAIGLTSLQIRFGASNTASQIYNILAVDTTVPTAYVLTLNRPIQEATNATASYMLYRCYITPPDSQFLSWSSIVDMVNGWMFKLNFSSSYFDLRDPQRQALGLAYYCGTYKSDQLASTRSPIYELWPHPTSGQSLYVRYRIKKIVPDFSDDDSVVPAVLDDQLIYARALAWYIYPWIQANRGLLPAYAKIGVGEIANLTVTESQRYSSLLLDAKRVDDQQALQTVWNRGYDSRGKGVGSNFPYPIDSNFFQSHPIFW